jgi:DNA-binding CsgD family transcriptional regulator
VAAGGTALDPDVVTQLLSASRRTDDLRTLTARDRDVLALMAEGHSNSAIAASLVISDGAVEKHIGNIFSKLCLLPSDAGHPPGARRPALPRILKRPDGSPCARCSAGCPSR